MLGKHSPSESVALNLEHYRAEAGKFETMLEPADAGEE